LVKPDFFS